MTIQLRRATAAQWTAANPILAAGEPGWDLTNDELRVGDGTTAWASLAVYGGGGGGLTTEQVQDIVGAMVTGNTETRVTVDYQDADGTLDFVAAAFPVMITFSLAGALTTGAGTKRIYNPSGRTLTVKKITAHVVTAPTGAAILLDANINGTTMYTTQGNRPSIAISGNASTSGSTDAAASGWDDGEYITVDVDQIGSTIAGSDLTGVIYAEY